MTEDDIHWLRMTYASHSEGDSSPIVARLAEDVEWVYGPPHPANPLSGTWHGVDGVLRFLDVVRRYWIIEHMTNDDIVIDGETAMVRVFARIRFKPTGRAVDTVIHHRFIIRDGLIHRFEEVINLPEILTAILDGD